MGFCGVFLPVSKCTVIVHLSDHPPSLRFGDAGGEIGATPTERSANTFGSQRNGPIFCMECAMVGGGGKMDQGMDRPFD